MKNNETVLHTISRKMVITSLVACVVIVLAFGINAIVVQDVGLFIIVLIFAIVVALGILTEGRYTVFSDESVAVYSPFGKKLREVKWSDVKNTLVYLSKGARTSFYVILITTEALDFSQIPEKEVENALGRDFSKEHQTVSLSFTTLKEFEAFKEVIPLDIADIYNNISKLYEKKRQKEEGKNKKN